MNCRWNRRGEREGRPEPLPSAAKRGVPRPTSAVLHGAGVELVTGFLGIEGGFYVVPASIAFADMEMREAAGALARLRTVCAVGRDLRSHCAR